MPQQNFLINKLLERSNNNALRSLTLPHNLIDFCSNDYLGIATNLLLPWHNNIPQGSTGSRLLAGNYKLIEEVEEQIAAFHQADSCLIFNSGYDANVGLLSCVPQRGDTVLYDSLSHASIRDGIRLSLANSYSFAHNSIDDVEKKLQHAKGNIFIVTESVFSMDGDTAPLTEMVAVATKHNAQLIVDEAHATGIIGSNGEGLVQHLNLQERIFARVHTFGKACGCHGAAVLGSKNLRSYLINFARSFIYSTALPPAAVASIQASYHLLASMQAEREQLKELIGIFRETNIGFEKIESATPIQAVIVSGNSEARSKAAHLQQQGFDVRPILYPTVPKGRERLRIVLHSFNTTEQLSNLLSLLQ